MNWQQPYSDEFIRHMYQHYTAMYQARNTDTATAYRPTWQAAFYWLTMVNYYGRILIQRALITWLQLMQDRAMLIKN
jgi:hypothetical protein